MIGGPTVCNSKPVHKAFNIHICIELTDTNAYDTLTDSVLDKIVATIVDCDVVISALGHASTVLGKRLYKLGVKTQFIDIGSVVDAISGVKTRGWIKKNNEYVEIKRKEFL